MTSPYDIAAYYWPAYHDEPRWRRFMPDGEGEWETIKKAKPKFPGHEQPRVPQWGYLDESDPAVIARYFTQPNYYAIDGKPVFSIYDLTNLINGLGGLAATREALDAFRAKAVAAGFPGLHLQAILWGVIPKSVSLVPGDKTQTQDNTVRALGFDSLTNYQWCHYVAPKGPYEAWAAKAIPAWEKWTREFSAPFYPHVSIGWDTNPRFKRLCDLVVESSPARFGAALRQAMAFVEAHDLKPRLITLNAWNEWSECSYLEPDVVHGMGYLEAVREALQAGPATELLSSEYESPTK